MESRIRLATANDLAALASLVVRANTTYRQWAGEEWTPPGVAHERARWRERLEDPAAWNAVATLDDAPLGCVSFTAARLLEGAGSAIPGIAHLSRLFVDPEHWGRGIGSSLVVAAMDEMRTRGYQEAQLFTAAGNARSRRFYEGHGWRPGTETRRWQGLLLVGYRIEL